MRIACLIVVAVILALAARRKIRDRQALKTAVVFTRAYLTGWNDGLGAAFGHDPDGLEVNAGHRERQLRAAREGRQ